MISLTFKYDKLEWLLKLAENRWRRWPNEVRTLYDETTGKGFWLVGDDGVYLMHNGKTTSAKKQQVVYAEECNPETMPFDTWWNNKNATFGADDGAEFIDHGIVWQAVDAGSDIVIEFSPGEMEIKIPGLIKVDFTSRK